jgi:hypothetical protein
MFTAMALEEYGPSQGRKILRPYGMVGRGGMTGDCRIGWGRRDLSGGLVHLDNSSTWMKTVLLIAALDDADI